jgi:hypothetical protein
MNHFTRRTTNILQSESKQKEKTMKTLMKKVLGNKTRTMQTAKKAITAVRLALTGVFLFLPNISYSADLPQQCTVNWSDPRALSWFYDQAAGGLGYPTTLNGRNELIPWDTNSEPTPTSAQTNTNRWQYRQNCGQGRISVWDQSLEHLHLGFKDPALNYPLSCFTSKVIYGQNITVTGRKIADKCVPSDDYSLEPRIASSHGSLFGDDDWWEILLLDRNTPGKLRTFDLNTISVGGDTPIQMWFRKVDGSVSGFNILRAGVNWDVSGSASGIVAVWIGNVTGIQRRGPWTINDFSITAH